MISLRSDETGIAGIVGVFLNTSGWHELIEGMTGMRSLSFPAKPCKEGEHQVRLLKIPEIPV